MNAAVFHGNGVIKLEEREIPRPGKDEVLVKVECAAICGTDIHVLAGDYYANPPVVLGHEFSGYITELGEGVQGLSVGQLVCIEPHTYCGCCKFCRIGKPHLCTDKIAYGTRLDGGFAQYACLPKHTVYPVPQGVTPQEAALAENISNCIHAVDKVEFKLGSTVVILGGGVVGILLGQMCRMRGASKIILSEPSAHRREMALRRCADVAVDPTSQSLEELVLAETAGLGADLVFEATGIAAVAQQGISLLAKGGTMVFFGVVPPGKTISLEPNQMFSRELTLTGSNINPFSFHATMELIKKLQVEELISHHYPLEQIHEAIEVARRGDCMKVCITPNR